MISQVRKLLQQYLENTAIVSPQIEQKGKFQQKLNVRDVYIQYDKTNHKIIMKCSNCDKPINIPSRYYKNGEKSWIISNYISRLTESENDFTEEATKIKQVKLEKYYIRTTSQKQLEMQMTAGKGPQILEILDEDGNSLLGNTYYISKEVPSRVPLEVVSEDPDGNVHFTWEDEQESDYNDEGQDKDVSESREGKEIFEEESIESRNNCSADYLNTSNCSGGEDAMLDRGHPDMAWAMRSLKQNVAD